MDLIWHLDFDIGIYALGANALLISELQKLYSLKGRATDKAVSWLVRDIDDIGHYAEMSPTALKVAHRFLPGPLTLVLPAQDFVSREVISKDKTIGFRISSDPIAQKVIAEFMEKYNAPLTCTSANISNMMTQNSVELIRAQFGEKQSMIDQVYDDGERKGQSSTIIKIVGDSVVVLREGAIPESLVKESL